MTIVVDRLAKQLANSRDKSDSQLDALSKMLLVGNSRRDILRLIVAEGIISYFKPFQRLLHAQPTGNSITCDVATINKCKDKAMFVLDNCVFKCLVSSGVAAAASIVPPTLAVSIPIVLACLDACLAIEIYDAVHCSPCKLLEQCCNGLCCSGQCCGNSCCPSTSTCTNGVCCSGNQLPCNGICCDGTCCGDSCCPHDPNHTCVSCPGGPKRCLHNDANGNPPVCCVRGPGWYSCTFGDFCCPTNETGCARISSDCPP
jgi:hypothetical protein